MAFIRGNVESEGMSERAMLLQQYIGELRAKVELEKQTLNTEREASSGNLKGLSHFPTCPLSNLADIDPQCAVHGHLSSVEWKLLPNLRMRGPHTLLNEPAAQLHSYDEQKNFVIADGEWLDFDPNFSTSSLPRADIDNLENFDKNQLPVPPSDTHLTSCQSYMSKLLEVDDLCKKEMSRVNAIAPNLDQLNQMASDWEVEAVNLPNFSRLAPEDNTSVSSDSFLENSVNNEDEDDLSACYSLMRESCSSPSRLKKATSQLETIEEFVKTLAL